MCDWVCVVRQRPGNKEKSVDKTAKERQTCLANELTVALDAMGGDAGPEMVLKGVALASERHPDARFVLFGDTVILAPLLADHAELAARCELRHAPDIVDPDAKPSQIVRRGQQTSMWQTIGLVKAGEADLAISAGNTGVLMAMSVLQLRTQEGIDRPAIASTWPGLERESVLLDLGANLECDEDNLVQFAIMGAAFARIVMGVERPRVALLNVGEEEQKGHEYVRLAAQKLRETPQEEMSFTGFVEGSDLGFSVADVIVTDGFSGNVALKTGEGSAKLIFQTLADAFGGSWRGKIAYLIARNVFGLLKEKFDPRAHNGGIFLGLNGLVIKSHGGTDEVGFAHAIDVGLEMARQKIINRIDADLKQYAQARAGAVKISREDETGQQKNTKVGVS